MGHTRGTVFRCHRGQARPCLGTDSPRRRGTGFGRVHRPASKLELVWTGLGVGEEDGGADVSLVGIAGLVEEVGRHALPSPLVATLSATSVLRAAGGEVARRLLARIAQGATASLAITDERGSWEPADAGQTQSEPSPAERL